MESLDLPTLCRIASHLQYWDFYSFVLTCRAFSACRDDPRTLATAIVNSSGGQTELMSFQFGARVIRFYAEHCAINLVEAVVSALDVAGYKDETRAIVALRPMCSENEISCVLEKCVDDLYLAAAALMHLDVDQKQRDAMKSMMSETMVNLFALYFELATNGVLPEDHIMFHALSYAVLWSSAIFAQTRFIEALKATDASGAYLVENVERASDLLITLSHAWEQTARIMGNYPLLCTCPRLALPHWIPSHLVIIPYQKCRFCHAADFASRLTDLVPRPISWDTKTALFTLFLKAGSIDAIKKLYSPSRVEAEWIYREACFATATNGDAFKLWILSTWDYGDLGVVIVDDLALQICRTDVRQQTACMSRLVAGASKAVKKNPKSLETALANLVARNHLDPDRLVKAVYEAAFMPVLDIDDTIRLFTTLRNFNLRLAENISKRFMQTCKNLHDFTTGTLDVFVAFERAFKDQSISHDAIAIGLFALVKRHLTPKMDERASIRANVDFIFEHWNDSSMAALERCIALASGKGDMSMTLHLADNKNNFVDEVAA